MTELADVLHASESLLQKLQPGDLDATLNNITHAAVEVLPEVDYASITMRHPDGTLDSYAVTDDRLLTLDERQFEWREGPCYEGTMNRPICVSGDLLHDERFPRYGPMAARAGIHSQAGIRLFENKRTVGGLNLYSCHVGAFQNRESISRLFSDHAAVALAYSIQIDQLHEAIRTRGRIGQAVGIVMERYKVPEQKAFAFLTRLSQTRNVKLRQIADELIASAQRS